MGDDIEEPLVSPSEEETQVTTALKKESISRLWVHYFHLLATGMVLLFLFAAKGSQQDMRLSPTILGNLEKKKYHFVWHENSKVMHDKLCDSTPWAFRHFTREGLNDGLAAHGCGDVYEAIMYQVVCEVTPKKHLKQSLKLCQNYNTTVLPECNRTNLME